MAAKLISDEHVPLGFEIVIDIPEVETGIVWNLWHNVQLSDDPEKWDNDIKRINQMQQGLGRLASNHRLVRAHIAEFCRYYSSFPRNIDTLCKEVGAGSLLNGEYSGCEGRRLLDILEARRRQTDVEKAILLEYRNALSRWLRQEAPKSTVDHRVFCFLGKLTKEKASHIDTLFDRISSNEQSITVLRDFSENMVRDSYGGTAPPYRAFSCFKCLPKEVPVSKCDCCWSRLIDSYILCVGASTANELKRFTEEYILAYSLAVNSWLMKTKSTPISELIIPQYIPKEGSLEITERINSLFGERDQTKEWLAACLLKTIKSNQRWHKGTELIDDIPEATSWFREK